MTIYSESEGYGSREKPYKTLSEAIDACDGKGKMVFVEVEEQKEKTYTLAEIKAAFWREFHLSGERWFGYHGTEQQNESSTKSEWVDFLRELEKGER